MLDLIDVWALFILFIVFIAALAGIANTMLMSTFERKHEFGMLLSLGCGPGRLSRIVAVEAVLLGITGVAVGTALGLGLVLLTSQSGIDYAALGGSESSYEVAFRGLQLSSHVYPVLHLENILMGVAAVLLTSFIAVIWPVLYLVRLEPMEALRP
jgi:putative ABC transport system permease protein